MLDCALAAAAGVGPQACHRATHWLSLGKTLLCLLVAPLGEWVVAERSLLVRISISRAEALASHSKDRSVGSQD